MFPGILLRLLVNNYIIVEFLLLVLNLFLKCVCMCVPARVCRRIYALTPINLVGTLLITLQWAVVIHWIVEYRRLFELNTVSVQLDIMWKQFSRAINSTQTAFIEVSNL